jgi:hypothetical protein
MLRIGYGWSGLRERRRGQDRSYAQDHGEGSLEKRLHTMTDEGEIKTLQLFARYMA